MRQTKLALAVVVVLVLATLLPVGAANRDSLGELIGRAASIGGGDATAVATVNGEAISVRAVEVTRAAMQGTGSVPSGLREAYQEALKYQIREVALSQEARRRGISVGSEEARAFLAQTKADAERSPQAKRFLEEQRKAMGLSSEAYDEVLLRTIRLGLLNSKLLAEVSQEAPKPTRAQVDVYLARQPGPNTLTLIPIHLAKDQEAEQVYKRLKDLQTTQPPRQFEVTFDSYALRLGQRRAGEFTHKTFRFASIDELPDYARSAVNRPSGSAVLTERADGTATISLVLLSRSVGVKEAQASARRILTEEIKASYAQKLTEELLARSSIVLHKEVLPAGARTLTADSLR